MSLLSARLAVGFSCLGHAMMHILAALYLTIVVGLERAWAMPYDELIGIWTFGSLMIGLGAPLAGWLGDRWSESGMIMLFFLITGLGSIAAGLADDTSALWIGLGVLGLGASIYHPVGMAWLVKNAPNRGKALGLLGVSGGIGVALAATIAGVLMDWVSWRAAFIVPGAVSVAIGVALAGCRAVGLVVDGEGIAGKEPPVGRGDALRAFIFLSVTMACGAMIFQGMQTAMPALFENRLEAMTGGSLSAIGAMVTIVYLLASGAQMVGGMLVDRYSLKKIYVLGLIVIVPALLLVSQLYGTPLMLLAALAAFMTSFVLPAENLMLARYTPAKHRGLAYGAKFVLAFGIAPLAVALVAWSYGSSGDFTLLLYLLAGFGLAAVIAALFLPGDRPQAEEPAPAPVPAE
jgi:MFS family permease